MKILIAFCAIESYCLDGIAYICCLVKKGMRVDSTSGWARAEGSLAEPIEKFELDARDERRGKTTKIRTRKVKERGVSY